MPGSQLFLIDAHALCYRSYYAIRGLITSKGQATNAVYGFVNTLRKIIREYNPAYMAVCFDVHARTLREKKYAEYKIQRPKMPDDLISQVPIIKEIVKGYNLPIFEAAGYEADDIIATIVKTLRKKDIECVIVSDDKDLYQLVNKNVKVFNSRKDKIMSYKDVESHLGLKPEMITDFIALAGDKSDNIPGVTGIGAVSAKKLIHQYGRLEDILRNIDELKPQGIQDKIREQEEQAKLSKELAVLLSDAPVHVQLKDMSVGKADEKKLFALFNDLEFRKLASELSKVGAPQEDLKVLELKSGEKIAGLIEKINKKGQMAFVIDFNSDELDFGNTHKIVLTTDGKEVYTLALGQTHKLKGVLADSKVRKIVYGLKETFKMLSEKGLALKGEMFDIQLAAYLLSPSSGSPQLSHLAWDHCKITIPENDRLSWEVKVMPKLYSVFVKELQDKNIFALLHDIEVPLSLVLAKLEHEGVALDSQYLNKLSRQCGEKIDALLKEIFKSAGEEFNTNSPKQLSHILFEKLGLPVIKKTKTGFSTDEGVLTTLAVEHPLPAKILEYRQLSKLKSTYLDALPKLVNSETKRIHGVFNQMGAETGRLSSNNPNLQNIPIRTELGRLIRKGFIASKKGNVLVAADYSQIELRILAHLSDDKTLIKAFKEEQDIHNFTAALIYDIDEKDVTDGMRYAAKRVNFGIVYGMSSFGLAKDLNVPQAQAQEFIDRYFLRYPGVKKFMDDEIRSCEKNGYVTTLLNRRRYIPEINSANNAIRQFAQRQAINTPVQGSAADLIKLAMIKIDTAIQEKKLTSKMILTVHDELVFDAPAREVGALVELVRNLMEGAIKLKVPIKVTVKKGDNWLDMKRV